MSKHTPGPWEYLTETNLCGRLPLQRGGTRVKMGNELLTVSSHAYGADEFFEKAAANARLIAAAPDLLKACKEFVRKCECGEARSRRSYAEMKAAIEKAEGVGA